MDGWVARIFPTGIEFVEACRSLGGIAVGVLGIKLWSRFGRAPDG